jgi:hypothetical protein
MSPHISMQYKPNLVHSDRGFLLRRSPALSTKRKNQNGLGRQTPRPGSFRRWNFNSPWTGDHFLSSRGGSPDQGGHHPSTEISPGTGKDKGKTLRRRSANSTLSSSRFSIVQIGGSTSLLVNAFVGVAADRIITAEANNCDRTLYWRHFQLADQLGFRTLRGDAPASLT